MAQLRECPTLWTHLFHMMFYLDLSPHYDDVHDSSFMDLSIFEYLLVSHDVTLSTPSSPTSRIFDINDEIEQHNSDDDSSSVSDPSPND